MIAAKSKMSFEMNIGLYFFFSSLVLLLTTTLLLYYFVREKLNDEIVENLESTVILASKGIDTDAFKRLTNRLSGGPLTEKEISSIENSSDYKIIYDELNDIRNTKSGLILYVYTMIPTSNHYVSRFVVDADVLELNKSKPGNPGISHFGKDYGIGDQIVTQKALTERVAVVSKDFVDDKQFNVRSKMGFAPIFDKNTHEFLGVIGADISDEKVSSFLKKILLVGLIIMLIAMIAVIIISIYLARSVSRPISILSENVKQFAGKQFNERATLNTHIKEISELVDNFNFMAETIQTYNNNILALNLSYERFVPVEFLNFLSRDHITQVQLGDQIQKDMAVMFTDIRSFTSLSESMTPKQTFNFLNSYLQRIGPVIRLNNGFVDKYLGDGVMALFPRTPDDAVISAIEMRKKVMEYNIDRVKWGVVEINTGIGIHIGTLMLGTIGEDKRMQGTVISDAVNLASRLESLTKDFGVSILISKEVFSRLESPERYKHRFLGNTNVKGKSESVPIFEIYDSDPDDIIAIKDMTKRDFESAVYYYTIEDYVTAEKLFRRVLSSYPNDKISSLYIEKCLAKTP